jgi:uncharacterized protein (DUF433 family)
LGTKGCDSIDYESSSEGFIFVKVKMFNRITFNPQIMEGRACIRGTWITVSLVVNLVANRMIIEEILTEYPDLEAEDIKQALQYAAFLTREEVYPITEGTTP